MQRLAWLLAAGALVAAPPQRYEVKRAASPIQIDGKADEPAWEAAGKIEVPAPSPTTVRLLWDDNFLYLAFECEDSDSVVIQIHPKPPQTDAYIGLEIDRRATGRAFLRVGEYVFRQFHLQGVRLSTYVEGHAWTAEVAIPWNNFDDLSRQHGAGSTWTANWGRGSAAPPPLDQFGELVFVK